MGTPEAPTAVEDYVDLDAIRPGTQSVVRVMVCRKWDVINSSGKFRGTEYIVSDNKNSVGFTIHADKDHIRIANTINESKGTLNTKTNNRLDSDSGKIRKFNPSEAYQVAIAMNLCAESPYWIYKKRRFAEAEVELGRLFGGSNVIPTMMDLPKSEAGDETGAVKISELIHGRYFKVVYIGSTLFSLQHLSGINVVFYFSSTVFRSVGVPTHLANVFIGVANLADFFNSEERLFLWRLKLFSWRSKIIK